MPQLTGRTLSTHPQRPYRADIDGLRCVAVSSVVLYHAGAPCITGGFIGVDIFFVISGYLIGGHLYTDIHAGTFRFANFYQRRIKRILPAFYAVLLFSITMAMLLLSPEETKDFGLYALGALFSASNLFYPAFLNYFSSDSSFQPLLMTWSLGVEEQFYLIIPLLMVWLARARRNWILPSLTIICALSFTLACLEIGHYPKNVFYLLPERAWELGAGVLLAVFEKVRKSTVMPPWMTNIGSLSGLFLLIVPMFWLTTAKPFPGLNALPAVLGAALVLAFPTAWVNRRVLSWRPFTFVGRVSYSWYLWHWPLLAFLRISAGRPELPPWGAAGAVAFSFLLAIASYRWVEQPFRNSQISPSRTFLRYAAVGIAILIPCIFLWRTGVPQRFPALAKVEHAALEGRADPCLARHSTMNLEPPCYSSTEVRPTVVLWGDSHASALAPGFEAMAREQGYEVARFHHAACLPLLDVANFRPSSPLNATQCPAFNQEVLRLIETNPHAQIVVLAGRWSDMFSQEAVKDGFATAAGHIPFSSQEANALLSRSLQSTVQRLAVSGKRMIVLNDVPIFSIDPLMNYRSGEIPVRRWIATALRRSNTIDPGFAVEADPAVVKASDDALKRALASFSGVPLIDLRREFCADALCRYRSSGNVFYADPQHLSPTGGTYALREFHLPAK